MSLLSNKQIHDELIELNGWVFKNNAIKKSYSFGSYMDGIGFVTRLAEKAEEVNHHPDIKIGWCKVDILLTTHDSGDVTKKDIELASLCDKINV